MACNIAGLTSGPYRITYDSVDAGQVAGAKILQYSSEARDITADMWGDTVVDGIFRGVNVFLVCVFKEWTAAVRQIIWPWDDSAADGTFALADFGKFGPMGSCMTDGMAMTLQLNAIANTPAESVGPTALLANKALLSPGHSPQIQLGTEERDVPVVFRLYPTVVAATGNTTHFTLTPTDGVV